MTTWSVLKKTIQTSVFAVFFYVTSFSQSKAINSAVLNFGSSFCGDRYGVTFSLIGNPLTNPYIMSSCSINPPFGDVFSKFIAYNPRDNKVYVNDISGNTSRLYIYDMGLPSSYICPVTMPMTPNYNYFYIPNNFEFDINGDLWSIRDLVDSSAVIERIDEATGTILFSKRINFPSDNIPNTLGSGDIVIAPNGRMFIVMGDNPGRFYEITNYNTSLGNATANFIQPMPRPCYGILYLNGSIELTGTDFGGSCYRYVYDVQTRVMGSEKAFHLGQTPVDNSSISLATGISKRLLGSATINDSTADIVYEVFAKNMGNVKLDNFNVTEDLGAVFGASNISFVNASIIEGKNPQNLLLNDAYDGVTNTKLLKDNQVMTNMQLGNIGFTILLRATNLVKNTIYYNTALSSGEIGNMGSRVSVIDSSNNGPSSEMDINQDGDPGDVLENIRTPFYFGMILPIKFIEAQAKNAGKNIHHVRWVIAPPPTPVVKFDVEYSEDKNKWQVAGSVPARGDKTEYYYNNRTYSTNDIFYRIRAYDDGGKNYISKVSVVKKETLEPEFRISPNPADNFINVYSTTTSFSASRRIQVLDVSGKKVIDLAFNKQLMKVNVANLTSGYYIVNVSDESKTESLQLLVKHQ